MANQEGHRRKPKRGGAPPNQRNGARQGGRGGNAVRVHGGIVKQNGPSRGDPRRSFDHYVALARDAATSGDIIASESYYQYAEHYRRLLNGGSDDGQNSDDGQT